MKKRQSILLAVALAALALAITACSKTETTTNSTNTSTTTNSTKTTGTTTTPTTSDSNSPSAVLKASFAAAKNKDVAAFKKSIATSDMRELEAAIQRGGGNLDELLKQQLEKPETPMPDTLETRNEKIDGDKATVEYKDVKGTWKTANFIKEGSEWKITLEDARAEQPAANQNSNESNDKE